MTEYRVIQLNGSDHFWAVFKFNKYGGFWQQQSKWYYRKGYANRILKQYLKEN